MKRITFTLIIFSIASQLLTSCGGEAQTTITEQAPITVTVAKVGGVNRTSYVAASGKVEAEKSANLSTRIMGFVTQLQVKVGQSVNKGQPLVSISSGDLVAKKAQTEAAIQQATAGYNNAKKDFDRFTRLFQQQSASQKELDDMTTRYEMMKAGLEAAGQMKREVEAQFAYTNIRAPFDGMVTNTFVKEGDMANPGMPLVAIESSSKLQVEAMVAESDIDAIKTGAEASVLIKSIDKEVKGVVSEVSTSAKNTGGQYLVKVTLASADDAILPGMFANVLFRSKDRGETASSTVTVPAKALVKHGQLTGIYTVGEGNVALLRWLRTGKSIGNDVEVLSGLVPNETFVVQAEGKIFNGAKITY